jgi:hypothetical protein
LKKRFKARQAQQVCWLLLLLQLLLGLLLHRIQLRAAPAATSHDVITYGVKYAWRSTGLQAMTGMGQEQLHASTVWYCCQEPRKVT